MEDKKQTVTVNIFGEDYPIRGDADSEYILKVAAYLDGKMREVSDRNANKSPTKVAILAALNITDELFRAQETTSKEIEDLEEKTQTIIEWLDSRMPEETAP